MIDTEIAAQVLAHLDRQEEATHSQYTYRERAECGTEMCVAGFAGYVAASDREGWLTGERALTPRPAHAFLVLTGHGEALATMIANGAGEPDASDPSNRHVGGLTHPAFDRYLDEQWMEDAFTDLSSNVLFNDSEDGARTELVRWVHRHITGDEWDRFLGHARTLRLEGTHELLQPQV